jgi:hypothetical protein
VARRVKNLRIADEGRDFNKLFVLTEAPARVVTDWVARLWPVMFASGVEIPDDYVKAGVSGLAAFANTPEASKEFAKVDVRSVKDLLDEVVDRCVRFAPDPAHPEALRRIKEDDDVEEVRTYFTFYRELAQLHLGFTDAGDRSSSGASPASDRASD